ncbi:COG1361 family protein [Candidatus Nitrosocosmicus sp. R]
MSPSDPNLDILPATDEDTVFLTAGKIDDFKFNITNNNNHPIQNTAVTLPVNTGALEILENSKWNLDMVNPKTTVQYPTKVFASKTLINSPMSFKVSVEYVSNGQLKLNSFFIGANVVGEIEVSINELSTDNIGGTLNVIGYLLNKGNTGGLFTTIEIVTEGK